MFFSGHHPENKTLRSTPPIKGQILKVQNSDISKRLNKTVFRIKYFFIKMDQASMVKYDQVYNKNWIFPGLLWSAKLK